MRAKLTIMGANVGRCSVRLIVFAAAGLLLLCAALVLFLSLRIYGTYRGVGCTTWFERLEGASERGEAERAARAISKFGEVAVPLARNLFERASGDPRLAPAAEALALFGRLPATLLASAAQDNAPRAPFLEHAYAEVADPTSWLAQDLLKTASWARLTDRHRERLQLAALAGLRRKGPEAWPAIGPLVEMLEGLPESTHTKLEHIFLIDTLSAIASRSTMAAQRVGGVVADKAKNVYARRAAALALVGSRAGARACVPDLLSGLAETDDDREVILTSVGRLPAKVELPLRAICALGLGAARDRAGLPPLREAYARESDEQIQKVIWEAIAMLMSNSRR